MTIVSALVCIVLFLFLVKRDFARAKDRKSKAMVGVVAALVVSFVVFATLKPPTQITPGGGGTQQLPGGLKLSNQLMTTPGSDGMPYEWKVSVFMDPSDPSADADSTKYDSTMTATEKYEFGLLDWRRGDTMGDGVLDAWKLLHELPLDENLAHVVGTNGLTFYHSYMLDANPVAERTNPLNAPLTDAQVVALGYSPHDVVPPGATNLLSGDVTIIRLNLKGAGAKYSMVRVKSLARGSSVVHAGRVAREYAIRSGEVFEVLVD